MYIMKKLVLVSSLLVGGTAYAAQDSEIPPTTSATIAASAETPKRNWLTFWRSDDAAKASKAEKAAAKAQAKADKAQAKQKTAAHTKASKDKVAVQPRNHSYSGYLVNYDDMADTQMPSGQHALRWVSPELKKGEYHAIMIDPIGYYPLPPNDARVSKGTMLLVARYLAEQARLVVGKELNIVTAPGPGVLRWDAAITGVSSEGTNIDNLTVAHIWEEKIPGGAVIPRKVEVYLESKLIDSQSKKLLAKSVRRGLGNPAPQNGNRLTVEEMKPVLNHWVEDARLFVQTSIK